MQPEELVTSLEQSKKLKKRGVEQDGFFLWCEVNLKGGKKVKVCSRDLLLYYDKVRIGYIILCRAFTFTEVSKKLPVHISISNHPDKLYYLTMTPHVSGRFDLFYYTVDNKHLFKQTEAMKDTDAGAEMLIYLIDQGIVEAH